jgi:inorganic pyrophosphatase
MTSSSALNIFCVMQDALNQLGAFDEKKDCVNVIIETPKGSRVKYAYDLDVGLFQVKKALPEGMTFPFNFGFIPGTAAEDGDPLDIFILNEEPLVPGCLLKVTVAGVIKAKQIEDGKSVRNDRVFGFALRERNSVVPGVRWCEWQDVDGNRIFF